MPLTIDDLLSFLGRDQGGASLGAVSRGETPSQIFHSYANPEAVLASPAAQFAGMGGVTKGVAAARLTPEEIASLYERYRAVGGPAPAAPKKPMTPEEVERLYEAWKNPFKTKAD